jgi:pimeloyl-ACP methyl ester carboxylesterase
MIHLLQDVQRISTPEGVDEFGLFSVGGVDQALWARGLHRENPVLLFVHGGPGSPASPLSWTFQKPWEDFFTIVHWDQRGVGKSRPARSSDTFTESINLRQLTSDAEQVADLLLKRFEKQKIVIMGWSYGTAIGLELCRRIPKHISVYVGVGQLSPVKDTEKYIYDAVLSIARERRNSQAIVELEAIAPYPGSLQPEEELEHLLALRKWVRAFNCGWYGHQDLDQYFEFQRYSQHHADLSGPELLDQSVQFIKALQCNDGLHYGEGESTTAATEFEIPMVFMMGAYDLQTPYAAAKSFFENISAPMKKFISFPRSAHFPMIEQPGAFLRALVDHVLPLTEGEARFEDLGDAPSNFGA